MEYDLIGGKPGQFILEGAVIGVGELGGMDLTCGNIRHCQAILLPLRTDGGDEVILSLIEHTGLHQGTRGDNPDHLPLDHALGKPAGSSICSQMATLYPFLISRAIYPSQL